MMRWLSCSIRETTFCDGRVSLIVDFEVDGESIWQRMKRLEPVAMKNTPSGNPDGTFVGVSAWSMRFKESLYREGNYPWQQRMWVGMMPLLACGVCGESGCGGVFTRIHVGRRRVFWSGLAFSGDGAGFGPPVYDRSVFVFAREQYDAALDELMRRVRMGDGND